VLIFPTLAGCAAPEVPVPTSTPAAKLPLAVVPTERPTVVAPTSTPRPASAIKLPALIPLLPAPTETKAAPPAPAATAPPTSTPPPPPTPTLDRTSPAISISRFRISQPIVTLTFDAGADRGDAPRLIAFLRSAGILATFGMTGRWAENNPDLVREIVLDGHELMNHTYDHRSLTGLSRRPGVLAREDRLAEIDRTDQIVRAIAGVSPKPLFRPPYGDQDASVLRDVALAGYRYSILWTIDTLGWKGASVAQIVDRSLRDAGPGAIYVLHVGERSLDAVALPTVVEGLRGRGYRFATVGDLLGLSR
jgi:peptidoglycan/xylan/chitin deacetylase (PgdA/CDA1 family)